jgi:hypothetical protein
MGWVQSNESISNRNKFESFTADSRWIKSTLSVETHGIKFCKNKKDWSNIWKTMIGETSLKSK